MAKVIGVSVGSDGTVWCVDSAGNAYMRVGSEWKRNPTAKASEVAVGKLDIVWCRNSPGEVYRLQGTAFNSTWAKDPPASLVISISAGDDGTLWVANSKGEAVELNKNQWNHDFTAKDVVEVSVGNAANVWYRNKSGNIFKRDAAGKWQQDTVAKNATSVSGASDGTVWVANNKGELWTKVGNDWKQNPSGRAGQVSTGKTGLVWCVNDDGEIFHAETADWNSGWKKVAAPAEMPGPTTYKLKEKDTVLSILRARHPGISTVELHKKSDQVAKLNKWPGTLANDYNGHAKRLKPGDVIILEA
jgi:hypothetical protein